MYIWTGHDPSRADCGYGVRVNEGGNTRGTRPTTLKGLRRKEGQRDRGTEGQKRRGKWPSFEITRLGLSVVVADLA